MILRFLRVMILLPCCWCERGIGVGRSLVCWRVFRSGNYDFYNVITGNIFVMICHFLVNFKMWDLSTSWSSVVRPPFLWKSHYQSCLRGKIIYKIAQFAEENIQQDFCGQICSLKYDYNNQFLQLENPLNLFFVILTFLYKGPLCSLFCIWLDKSRRDQTKFVFTITWDLLGFMRAVILFYFKECLNMQYIKRKE